MILMNCGDEAQRPPWNVISAITGAQRGQHCDLLIIQKMAQAF